MFCKYCGAKLPDDSQFCSGCGKKLISLDLSPSNETPTAKPTTSPQTNKPPVSEISVRQQDKAETQFSVASSPVSSFTKSKKAISLKKSTSVDQPVKTDAPIDRFEKTIKTVPPIPEPAQSADISSKEQPASKKSLGGKIIAIIAAAVLLIGCAVGVSFSFLKNKQDLEQGQEKRLTAQEASEQEIAEQEKMKAERAQAEAEKATAEAEAAKAKAEAEQAKAEAEKAAAEAAKAQADAAKAQAQAQAQADAAKAQAQAQAQADAAKAQAAAEAEQAQARAAQQANMQQRMLEVAQDTFYDYIYSFTDAVNNNDFSLVAPVLLRDSDIYNEQKKVVPYFAEQGITETVVSVSIKNIWLEGDDVAAVVSDELIGVTYGDGSYREISQSYTYYMQKMRSQEGDYWWQIYKMVEA